MYTDTINWHVCLKIKISYKGIATKQAEATKPMLFMFWLDTKQTKGEPYYVRDGAIMDKEMNILPIKIFMDVYDFGSLSFLHCKKLKLPKSSTSMNILMGKILISLSMITLTYYGSPWPLMVLSFV